MRKILTMILMATLMVFSVVTFAQDIQPLPEVNIFEKLAGLLLNWSGMSDLAKGSVIVLILVQALKQVKDFEYKNTVVALFSVIYAIFQMQLNGSSAGSAIITALFSMGGAVLIYNAIKPILLKIPFFSFLKLGSGEK